jgi:hypothetical protein
MPTCRHILLSSGLVREPDGLAPMQTEYSARQPRQLSKGCANGPWLKPPAIEALEKSRVVIPTQAGIQFFKASGTPTYADATNMLSFARASIAPEKMVRSMQFIISESAIWSKYAAPTQVEPRPFSRTNSTQLESNFRSIGVPHPKDFAKCKRNLLKYYILGRFASPVGIDRNNQTVLLKSRASRGVEFLIEDLTPLHIGPVME